MPRRPTFYQYGNEPLAPQQRKPNVALELGDFDQQLQSPLYDGTIPPDIRKIIFDYAMTEYVDGEALYPPDADYVRPNFLGKKTVSINLLLMCKRSYLETRHLPPVKKTHAFWHAEGPPEESDDELGYFRRFQPAQLALVREIHLFTEQWWMEGELPKVFRLDILQGIEKVKITLRKGDWWWSERNAPLAITPHRSGADVRLMKEDWKREKAGEVVKWDPNCWGSAFRSLKVLKELEMEFETYDFKSKELDEIVRHAVMWRFPMADGKVLSADGIGSVRSSCWRGPPSGWAECPSCLGREEDSEEEWEDECRFCEEMHNLKRRPGPMLIIRSLTWRLADAN
ncbi:unnamed protein product [Calypogeia fissa]